MNKYKEFSRARFKRQCLGAKRMKIGFDSEKLAMMAIRLNDSKSKRVPKRAYKCDICSKWHLTSRR